MNEFLKLLRSMQAPAVDTETGYHDPYQSYANYSPVRSLGNVGPRPKVKSVVTETEGQPRKITTTYDYPQPDTREIGSLSMGPLSMMSAERRGYDPMLMQSEPKIPYDEIVANQNRLRVPPYANVNPNISGIDNAYTQRMGGVPLYNVEEAIKNVDVSRGTPFDVISNLADSASAIPNPLDAVGPVVNFLDETGRGMVDAVLPEVGAGSDVVPGLLGGEALVSEKGAQVDALKKEETPVGENFNEANEMINTGMGEANPAKYEILQSMYGKYARDPKARKQQYLDQISKIYRNAILLNAIAEFTGGRSQAAMYVKMATDKMDAVEKFDNEERMHGIWKDVFFDQSGQFRSPANWQETYEAVIKLGGTIKEAEELASSMFKKPSSTDKTPGGVTTEQYMLWKKMTSQAQTPEQKADAEAYGRMVGAIKGDRSKITPNTAGNLITKIDMGEIPDNGMRDKLLKIINDALPDQESSGYKEFQTEEQVQSALESGQIKLGDIVIINGRRARVE